MPCPYSWMQSAWTSSSNQCLPPVSGGAGEPVLRLAASAELRTHHTVPVATDSYPARSVRDMGTARFHVRPGRLVAVQHPQQNG